MTESEKADTGGKSWHPVIRLALENPISAANCALIIFGGAGVYWSNESRMNAVEDRVARIERSIKEDAVTSNAKDDRTNVKIEGISRELGDVKVSVGRVEAAVQFLVRQATQSDRRGPQ